MDSETILANLTKISKTKGAKTSGFILGFMAVMLMFSTQKPTTSMQAKASIKKVKGKLSSFPIPVPTLKYGFAVDTFQLAKEGTIQSGQFLGDILNNAGLNFTSIEKLVTNAKDVFDVRQFRVGKDYLILSKDTTQGPDFFIYEPNAYSYIIFDLKKDMQVKKVERPISTQVSMASGEIESSLWNAMTDNGLSYELTAKMEDALQWSIDFHHVQKGDQFKAIYDQDFIDNKEVGVGKVHAAWYKNSDNEHYAIYFDHPEHGGYYDAEGRPMNKGFLKSPVKYSRITSGYNLRRFHPILKRTKPHFGTDYAAPHGTPILAVGSGVVTKASRTRGNGNFVKIRHDKTYETQYLHMQKFAPGITSGAQVIQGQVIGYVGSTGLATGPHVCFRFWENGKQVDHRKLNFPPPAPLPEEFMPAFSEARNGYIDALKEVKINTFSASKIESIKVEKEECE